MRELILLMGEVSVYLDISVLIHRVAQKGSLTILLAINQDMQTRKLEQESSSWENNSMFFYHRDGVK